jgi:hypothetical protein
VAVATTRDLQVRKRPTDLFGAELPQEGACESLVNDGVGREPFRICAILELAGSLALELLLMTSDARRKAEFLLRAAANSAEPELANRFRLLAADIASGQEPVQGQIEARTEQEGFREPSR